jgi:hypothetical protein
MSYENALSEDFLTNEQIGKRFETLFACKQDRRRLFEDYMPHVNYYELANLAFHK